MKRGINEHKKNDLDDIPRTLKIIQRAVPSLFVEVLAIRQTKAYNKHTVISDTKIDKQFEITWTSFSAIHHRDIYNMHMHLKWTQRLNIVGRLFS